VFLAFWRVPPVELLLLLALVVHSGLGLRSLIGASRCAYRSWNGCSWSSASARHRSCSCTSWEPAAVAAYGVDDTHAYVLWRSGSSILLGLGQCGNRHHLIHGCIGLHGCVPVLVSEWSRCCSPGRFCCRAGSGRLHRRARKRISPPGLVPPWAPSINLPDEIEAGHLRLEPTSLIAFALVLGAVLAAWRAGSSHCAGHRRQPMSRVRAS
jgi:hypothetical protein